MESLGRLLGVVVPCCHDALSRTITPEVMALVECAVKQSPFIEPRAVAQGMQAKSRSVSFSLCIEILKFESWCFGRDFC